MSVETIAIEVTPEAALAYAAASAEERRKINALLSLKFSELMASQRDVETLLEEMGRQAQARGLTPQRLDELLRDE